MRLLLRESSAVCCRNMLRSILGNQTFKDKAPRFSEEVGLRRSFYSSKVFLDPATQIYGANQQFPVEPLRKFRDALLGASMISIPKYASLCRSLSSTETPRCRLGELLH